MTYVHTMIEKKKGKQIDMNKERKRIRRLKIILRKSHQTPEPVNLAKAHLKVHTKPLKGASIMQPHPHICSPPPFIQGFIYSRGQYYMIRFHVVSKEYIKRKKVSCHELPKLC